MLNRQPSKQKAPVRSSMSVVDALAFVMSEREVNFAGMAMVDDVISGKPLAPEAWPPNTLNCPGSLPKASVALPTADGSKSHPSLP